MNILFFHTPHYRLNLISQIELEIIISHLKKGDDVKIVMCDGKRDLGSCVTNTCGKRYYCHTCRKTQEKMYVIASKFGKIDLVGYQSRPSITIPKLSSLDELRAYRYKNINVGVSANSTIVSTIRDHEYDVNKYQKRIERELCRTIQAVDTIEYLCGAFKPDMVYVFNGRMSEYSSVVNWCQQNNQDYRVYEFGARREVFRVLDKSIPHNVKYVSREILNFWNDQKVEMQAKIDAGTAFFENTRKGISLLEQSFITAQRDGELPEFDPNKELITFYNSSIDEFASVQGWEKYIDLFEDETQGIKEICEQFKDDKSKQFILRIHPNLKYLKNTQNKKLETLKALPNLIFIEPQSKVSSYSLMDKSSKIITFGSTIGVESNYFGIPSITLGLNFYQDLDVTYMPKSKEELFNLIDTQNLKAKPRINSIKYGYWWVTFGEYFVHRDVSYNPKDLELSTSEKLGVLVRKFFSLEPLRIFSKLFNPNVYLKLKDKRFRQDIRKEFTPWNKF